VPTRRTRDPKDVSTEWSIDAYQFSMPILAAPMDSVMSPETAIEIGKSCNLINESTMDLHILSSKTPEELI
jgi:hypothetical protein